MRSRRSIIRWALTAPAPAALVALLVLLGTALVIATRPVTTLTPVAVPTAAVMHELSAGLSAFPATARARWIDAAGVGHDLPLDPDQPVRVPARAAFVAVSAGDQPVQCTLRVDWVTVDAKTARNGVEVCAWTATG